MKKTKKQKHLEKETYLRGLTPHLAKLSEQFIKDVYGEGALEYGKTQYFKKYPELKEEYCKNHPDHPELKDKARIIDIHTNNEVTNADRYRNSINSTLVKEYVYQNIKFPLTENYWGLIDTTFSEIWNNKIGIGGEFYWDEISKMIFSEFQKQRILIEYGRIDIIANLMLTYIENNGGFLE
ncbi:MAG: hypothetical protein HY840_15245 [Bacteroidetes bacterium]|nr:hypothetical protein [Bacteroidota bacterium]